LELAAHGHVPDGRHVVEIGLEVRDVDYEVVIESDGAEPSVDPRVRQEGVHLAEPERLGSHPEVGDELRLGEAKEALPAAILRGTVVDAERVRLGREVAVDLERRECARDRRRVDLPDLPPDPRARVDAEVAHERREVDARPVEAGVLEATAVRQRIDDCVGEDESSAREVQCRLRALDDVVPDRQLAR
jgi:hypothetical protein